MDHPINDTTTTILHKPIGQCSNHPSHELTNMGFDINAPNENGLTHLHQAIFHNDVEMVSMLLYHGADVNLEDGRNFTPFLLAVALFNLPAVVLLSKYHDHFCPRFRYGYYKHILDIRTTNTESVIHNKFFLDFMMRIWDKLDGDFIKTDMERFLTNYLKESDSIRNLNLRATCFFILEFTLPFYLDPYQRNYNKFNFSELFILCEQRLVVKRDRLGLTWTWLSLGAEVFLNDVKLAFKLYGYDEEVEALISTTSSPLLTFIVALEENGFQKYLSHGFKSPINHSNTVNENAMKMIETWLNFFAVSWSMKQELFRKGQKYSVLEKLVELPEVPSLRELSRNQAVKFIKKNFEIRKVEEYRDIVGKLEIPKEVKNILLFNTPLYVLEIN